MHIYNYIYNVLRLSCAPEFEKIPASSDHAVRPGRATPKLKDRVWWVKLRVDMASSPQLGYIGLLYHDHPGPR